MNYIPLIREVAFRLDRTDIHEEFKGMFVDKQQEVEYLAEQVRKLIGWEGLFDVVFGDELNTMNEGIDGLYEFVIQGRIHYISNKTECGFSRENAFRKSLQGDPKWLKREVANRELESFQYYGDEYEEYVEFLRGVKNEQ